MILFLYSTLWHSLSGGEVNPYNAVVNVCDHDIVVSEFEFQSCYYIHFRTNTLGKGMDILTPPTMG